MWAWQFKISDLKFEISKEDHLKKGPERSGPFSLPAASRHLLRQEAAGYRMEAAEHEIGSNRDWLV
jgi:hypothetical protein